MITVPPSVAQLAVATVPTEIAGVPFSITVLLLDSSGNPVPNADSTSAITLSRQSGTGTLGGTLTGRVPIGAAAVTISGVTYSKAESGVRLLATGSGPFVSAFTGTSNAFTVNPGTATQLAMLTEPSSAAQNGAVLGQQPVVQLRDSNENPVSQAGIVISAALASGASGASLGGSAAVTTDGSGNAHFANLAISGPVGSYTLRFSAPALTTATSSPVSLTAGAATQLLVSAIPTQTAGTPFSVTVTLADASGNPVVNSGAAGTITLSRQSGTGTLGGTLSGTLALGASQLTISGITYSQADAAVKLLATGSGAGSAVNSETGTSNAFVVNAASGGGGGGGGAGLPALPNIYPTDGSYGWTFDGTSNAQRCGGFEDGQGTCILTTTNPDYQGWSWATGEGPNGINAIKRTYPQSTLNVGPAFFLFIHGQQKLFVRLFYKQSNPFNYDGRTNNADWLKLMRFEMGSGTQILTPGAAPGGPIVGGWDSWSPGSTPQGTWSFNSVLGTWNCYEAMIDLTVANQAHETIWVNDTVVLDNTVSGSQVTSATTTIPVIQFDGTVNSMAIASTAWFTMIGVSTQRMGCPAGFTFPQ
jgi:hypothetical protein